jgi:ATP-dependent Clp protease ATP-binding subunit ClpA
MFERFTPRARRVIVLAQDSAREMSHPQIRPEHLLLALREGEGMASNAMAQSGVEILALRKRVAERITALPSARKADKVPFSPEAKKCLELSLREALALGHNYIGTEHIFLGVQGEAAQHGHTLDELLATRTDDVHERLKEMLKGATPAPPVRSPGLQIAMNAARQRAGQAPVTTGHLLAAIIDDAACQAGRALTSLGINREVVQTALDSVPVNQTSDAPPSPHSVTITIGSTTTVIGDLDFAAALEQLNAEQLREAIESAIRMANPDQAEG